MTPPSFLNDAHPTPPQHWVWQPLRVLAFGLTVNAVALSLTGLVCWLVEVLR